MIGLLTVVADDRDKLFEAMEALEPTAALVSSDGQPKSNVSDPWSAG